MGIDLSKCIGCQYCLWACQATNNVADDDMRWNVDFPERTENGADFFMTRPWAHAVGHMLHRLTPVMAAVGLGLSLLHQSSLGATYGVLSGREIWFKPSMPVLFILSAIAGGVSLTLLVTLLVSKLSGREVIDKYLRRDIARLAAFALLAYLYLKLWDRAATSYYSHAPGTADALLRLQATTPYTQSFWLVEVFLGIIIPVIILLNRPLRRQTGLLVLTLGLKYLPLFPKTAVSHD